jgi:hypothetical protein
MIIGVCGLGYTGSAAVLDLLSEYDNIQIQKGTELSISYRPDGLEDLAYNLTNPRRFTSSDIAIYRFRERIHNFFRGNPKWWGIQSFKPIYERTDLLINALSQIIWDGYWTFDLQHLSYTKSLMFRINNKLYRYLPNLASSIERKLFYRQMYLSINPINLYNICQEYTSDLFSLLGFDPNNMIVSDQLFSGDNPLSSFPFYKNPKAIVVDKDPRDLYVLCKFVVKHDCAWTPTDNVETFIEYYRLIREKLYSINDKNVLLLKFEDLIYNYDSTKKTIEDFLCLSESDHVRVKSHFNPNKSIVNTQLYKRYPVSDSEIKKIEMQLSEYIFDYSNLELPELTCKAF